MGGQVTRNTAPTSACHSPRASCRGTFKALGLACFSHILKIGQEASTSLRYFGKFYSAFLQLLSILLSMVLRRRHGMYTNSTLPWPSVMSRDTAIGSPGAPWRGRNCPSSLHPSKKVSGVKHASAFAESDAPVSSWCQP